MANLNGTLSELQAAYRGLTAYGQQHLITFAVADFGGLRTLADTNRILTYRKNDYEAALKRGAIQADTTLNQFRPIAPFGSSYHNYGAAFDILIMSKPAGLTDYQAKKILAVGAPGLGLRWGGTFSNPDTPHFELAIPLDEAKRRWAAYQGGGGAGQPGTSVGPLSSDLADPGATGDDYSDPTLYDTADSVPALEPDATTEYAMLGLVVAAVLWYVIRRTLH
jgi:D-alanyl-D-alanine carboxypeptidase